jgi:hypothetical protein
MKLPYISGYKPRGNYQALLANAVEDYLARTPGYLDVLADAPALSPEKPPAVELTDPAWLFEDPPESIDLPEPGRPWATGRARRVDFAERDAANRHLGRLGEEFVVELERARLRGAGRDELARRVDWVSETAGDGLGFDVRSFDVADGSERLIEVKTTGLGKYFPFRVTATEVRCSEDPAVRYSLYRVFEFARAPRLYILEGSLKQSCRLEPTQFLAGARPAAG